MDNYSGSDEDEEVKSFDFTKKTWRDDVTFLVEDQRFYATKVILAIASPVFEAMFGTNFKESGETEIPLPGKNPDDFNEFLKMIYPNTKMKICADNVYKLLPLADEYDVKSVVKKCRRYLSFHLKNDQASTEEILLCHSLATRYKFQGLRDVCASRLSDIGLKQIQSSGLDDTETLLELHRDILKKQGELLDSTRTELTEMYMKSDLSLETVSERNFPFWKGAIIKFKTCLDLSIEDRKISSPVSVWNINFAVITKITKRGHVDYLSVLLTATYPEEKDNLACVVDAKLQLRHIGTDVGPHHCFSIREKEFSKESKISHGFRRRVLDLIADEYFVDEKIDTVIYFVARKPFVKNQ